jgi:hypothetical protein
MNETQIIYAGKATTVRYTFDGYNVRIESAENEDGMIELSYLVEHEIMDKLFTEKYKAENL